MIVTGNRTKNSKLQERNFRLLIRKQPRDAVKYLSLEILKSRLDKHTWLTGIILPWARHSTRQPPDGLTAICLWFYSILFLFYCALFPTYSTGSLDTSHRAKECTIGANHLEDRHYKCPWRFRPHRKIWTYLGI